MPHLTLEYSRNLPVPVDLHAVLHALHAALAENGAFRIEEIKSRVVAHEIFLIGDGSPESIFVHLMVAILTGRDAAERERLTGKCLVVLREGFAPVIELRPCDVTVEIREMDRASYGKQMNALARGR